MFAAHSTAPRHITTSINYVLQNCRSVIRDCEGDALANLLFSSSSVSMQLFCTVTRTNPACHTDVVFRHSRAAAESSSIFSL